MLFNSFVFAGLFLPLTLLIFWCMPSPRMKRIVLVIGSLVFYSYWMPVYLILLLGFVGIAWWCAVLIERTRATWPMYFAGLSLFGSLVYYKYSSFIGQVTVDIGIAPEGYRITQLALPLGISFIVFQAMGYVIDVHRGQFPAEKRLSVVLLFKAFFPQLIAGPICRAHELMPQLKGHFDFRLNQFTSGLAIFALGMLLKEFFADGLAPLVNGLYAPKNNYSFDVAWAASIGFGGQIYADFWGYSTMAVGIARMFAIDIPTNFHIPYISTSLREFWRRWHITLSQWLRDYLYKPLGGSRHGTYRTVQALLLTMLLGGFWHGANYTFLIWGAIHGIALVVEHLFNNKQLKISHKKRFSVRNFIGWLYTFFIVFVAWVFFRANDLSQATRIISGMFSPLSLEAISLSLEIKQIAFLITLLLVIQFPIEWMLNQLRRERLSPSFAVAIAFISFIAAVVLGAPAAVPFIYFQF